MASTKRKAPPVKVAQPATKKSAKPTARPRVNESHTSVAAVPKNAAAQKSKGEVVVEISSDSESQGDDASMDGMDEQEDGRDRQATANGLPLRTDPNNEEVDSVVNNKLKSTKTGDEDGADASDDGPTFGDLVREQETVDVSAMLGLIRNSTEGGIVVADGASNGLTKPSPSLASLGNLLNAALRNNDDANLEVCFNTTTDATWVRNTIQRMDPALAGPLLQKLAARMYRRPGRAQTLIGWVQWTLITHGGVLASQPGVTKSLQELHRVLEERARGLNSLLLLKGKLDMLEAQMQLRRGHRGGGRLGIEPGAEIGGVRANGGGGRRQGGRGRRSSRGTALVDEEEDDVVVYVEGQDDGTAGQVLVAGGLGDSDDEIEDMDDDDEDSDDVEGLEDEVDDDIEELDAASLVEEDEIDFDDVDEEEEEEEEEEEDNEDRRIAPPTKMQKKSANVFSKRR